MQVRSKCIVQLTLERVPARGADGSMQTRKESHLPGVMTRIDEFVEMTQIVQSEGERVGVWRGRCFDYEVVVLQE